MVNVEESSPEKHSKPIASCEELEFVTHTTHVSQAMQIVESGWFNAGLVYDESSLRKKRILVGWVSPYDWSGLGYRYGTVQFKFRWPELIEKKRFYWVEVAHYNTPVCRILITEKKRDKQFSMYDPKSGKGPWIWDEKSQMHWWNGSVCPEFMIERDMFLDESCETTFVHHSDKYCCLNRHHPKSCSELSLTPGKAHARFIAGLTARGLDFEDAGLVLRRRKGKLRPQEGFESAVKRLVSDLCKLEEFVGSLKASAKQAPALKKCILEKYCAGKKGKKDRLALQSLFASRGQLTKACLEEVQRASGVKIDPEDEA